MDIKPGKYLIPENLVAMPDPYRGIGIWDGTRWETNAEGKIKIKKTTSSRFVDRVVYSIIDFIFLNIFLSIIIWFVNSFFDVNIFKIFSNPNMSYLNFNIADFFTKPNYWSYYFLLAIAWGIYAFLGYLFLGGTVGQRLCSYIVKDNNGAIIRGDVRVSLLRAILLSIIVFVPLFYFLINAFWGGKSSTFIDWLIKTWTVWTGKTIPEFPKIN